MEDKKFIPALRFKGFTKDWKEELLGECANIIGGGTPSTLKKEYWDGEIDWYSPAEIGSKIYVDCSQRKITKLGLQESSAKILPAGTVLFSSRAGIGNTAILAKESATNQGFQSIVPLENILDSYYIFSRTKDLKKYGETNGAGSTFIEVSGKQMANMPIINPEFDEQEAIGRCFASIDRLIVRSEAKLAKLKSVKKACLEKMFPRHGSRTPQLRFKGFTDEWEHTYLKNLGNWDKGRNLPKSDLDINGVYSCIHYGELFAYTEIINTVNSRTNVQNESMSSGNDLLFPDSDVTPDGLGRCSSLRLKNVMLGGGINILKLRDVYDAPYMSLNINKNKNQIIERVTGTTVRHIHSKELDNIELYISSRIDEQQKIGSIFQKLNKLITNTEQKIEKLKSIKKACLEKMLVNT